MMAPRRKRYAIVAVFIACGLLLSSAPLVPTAAPHRGAALLSLDICHPAQALSAVSAHCTLAAPAFAVWAYHHAAVKAVGFMLTPVVTLAAGPPDTPPPKLPSLI